VAEWPGPSERAGDFAFLYDNEAQALAKRAAVVLQVEYLSPPSKPGPGEIRRTVA
jgi:hypothetical protein